LKKIFFDLKSWGPLKNFKTRSGPYLGLGLSINVKKNGMEISLDCPFKRTISLDLICLKKVLLERGLGREKRHWN
jgi:hypothetical protein